MISVSGIYSAVDESAGRSPCFAFRWRQPLLLIALYTLGFLVLISALRVQFGFPLDDSYIHQTVARNLARYGIPGFIPGQRSSGATSLIWTYIQAANYRFIHIDPVLYNLGFSWIMFAFIGPLLFALGRRDGLTETNCWILAGTPALCGNFMWLGMIGMEHLLFVMLSLAAIYFWFDTDRSRLFTAILSGLAVGLLAITRPEAMVFGPLLLVAAYRAVHRPLVETSIVAGLWAAFLTIILGANLYTSHALMPATLKGRTWLYFHTSGGPHSVGSIIRFLGAWIQRLPRQFSTRYVGQMSSLSQVHGSFALFGFALAILAVLGMVVLLAMRPLRVSFLILWASIHFLIYLATFPTSGHGGRYQPLTLMLVFPCLFFGAAWLFERKSPVDARWPAMATGVVILLAGAASLRTWRVVTLDGVEHINETHGMAAQWLKQHVPPNAAIAAFDIGRISYDWGYGITDLGGLVDPNYYHYLVEGRVPDYLKLMHIQYLILPGVGTDSFGFQAEPLGMTKVAEYCSPDAQWLIGWRYTINATRCQELYRLSYAPTPALQEAKTATPTAAINPAPRRRLEPAVPR